MKNELSPVKKQQTYENILGQIRNLIEQGDWKPGQKLPSENELTNMLQVGRTSVREALRMLEAMEYIQIKPGDGSYVQERILIPLGIQRFMELMKGDEYTMQLMETRELIESQIAFLAAESATDENIVELESLLEEQKEDIANINNKISWNREFHLGLAKMTGNQVLVELQQLLFQLASATILGLFKDEGRAETSLSQHVEILEVIKSRQPVKAHKLMLEHLRSRYILPRKIDSKGLQDTGEEGE